MFFKVSGKMEESPTFNAYIWPLLCEFVHEFECTEEKKTFPTLFTYMQILFYSLSSMY